VKSEIIKMIRKIDTTGWKKVHVEFGKDGLEISVPPDCVELSMRDVPLLPDPKAAFEEAFNHPIGSPALEEIIRKKGNLLKGCLRPLRSLISQGPFLIKGKMASSSTY
jgi:hypothetical protein